MYARVAVASNALTASGLPVPVANLIHATLLGQINAHARLVFSDDPEVAALVRAIRSGEGIPQDSRTRWIETLTRLAKLKRIKVLHEHRPIAEIAELAELRTDWGMCADLAVVANDACEALGIPVDVGLASTPGMSPDVATVVMASRTPALLQMDELAEVGNAAAGSSRDVFWDNVLEPLAIDAHSVTILDGYLFKCLLDIAEGRPWAHRWRGEHLAWLLGRLDSAVAPEAEVHLVGAALADYRHLGTDDISNAIRSQWRPAPVGRLKAVKVSLASPPRGERFPHDRHIRFSTGGAIEISAGFDRLRDALIWDTDGMRWKYVWNTDALRALERAEARAVSYAEHPPALVVERRPPRHSIAASYRRHGIHRSGSGRSSCSSLTPKQFSAAIRSSLSRATTCVRAFWTTRSSRASNA
jgi:hypothetical protein